MIQFTKMHGAGNDFIVMEAAALSDFSLHEAAIRKICDRKRGIGADGLFVLSSENESVRMKFFNNDGSLAEMCGNGLRCAALYSSRYLKPDSEKISFMTDSGATDAEILESGNVRIGIPLKEDFHEIEAEGYAGYYGVSGVPHFVLVTSDVALMRNFNEICATLRHSDCFGKSGTNVDFISFENDRIRIRTYERGVEDETLACGTGIAGAAYCACKFYGKSSPVTIISAGNDVLTVEITEADNILKGIRLTGPAREVFRGSLSPDFLTDLS